MLEDFADLDIDDEPSGPNREDRIRSAFEKSKESYASELVVTEPGVSAIIYSSIMPARKSYTLFPVVRPTNNPSTH